jgi:hypothetical protein
VFHHLNSLKSISLNDHIILNYLDRYHTNFVIYFDDFEIHRAINHLKTFQADLDLYKHLSFEYYCYLFKDYEDS